MFQPRRKLARLRGPVFARSLLGLGLGGALLAIAGVGHAEVPVPAAAMSDAGDAAAMVTRTRRRAAPMPSLAPVVEKVQPAVVSIRAVGSMGPMGMAQGIGSGFILSDDGVVVTNHHVVAGADRYEVRLADGRRFRATLRGSDQFTDLAVLQIEGADRLPTLALGSSSELRVGDYVVAIGSPLGLESTVTSGIVSAKGRGDLGLYRDSYLDFVQTDAAISRGSSGGPLVDLRGRVVGVNTAVAGPGNGLGFSIPIDQAKQIIPQLRDQGKVARGWLGVAGRDVQPALGGDAPLEGAAVGQVIEGSPADAGGLETGDLILSVNGDEVDSFADLRGRVAMMAPGTTLSLVVRRGKELERLKVTLGDLEREREVAARGRTRRDTSAARERRGRRDLYEGRPTLGVMLAPGPEGLVIQGVQPGSLAARLELEPGDVLLEINGVELGEARDVGKALGQDRRRARVKVRRDGTLHMSMIEVQD